MRRGEELWQYVDEGAAHGGDAPRTYYRYKQRLDGFTSLDADDAIGTATTRPLVTDGSQLLLNVNATGWIKVALLDAAGNELPGFGLDDCDTISTDSTAHTVTWHGSSDLSRPASKAKRLKFAMQKAKLFAFELAP